ncbi:MAG TPA: DUF4398 domain-containing protein [Rhodanobacteraceae bacterium]|jgi:hypothetical protein|nr:DUF4398 domain-containing protein [Rhodanobacteraceae bacterium]
MARSRFLFFGLPLFAAFAASSAIAASVDRDTAELELTQAITAVQAAERDDAARYAAPDLDEAHAMLGSAQRAADARDWTSSATFAERAKVSGDLASARSRQHRAEAATAEIRQSVDALREQLGGEP